MLFKPFPVPISRPCTFPPAHWRLILHIHDFSLVIGGKLHSEYLGFSLNYWWQIILGTFPFFFTGGQVADTYHMFTKYLIFQIILYTILLIICVERLLHIGSHFFLRKWWRRPHFLTKLAAVASFSYKIGGGGKDLATLLTAVLTWSGFWFQSKNYFRICFFFFFNYKFFGV